jgi:hypothetical protein
MSFFQKIIGYVSGNGVEVDSNNKLLVNLPTDYSQSGGVVLVSRVNESTDPIGTSSERALEASPDYRLRTGIDTSIFNLSFEGTTAGSYRGVLAENATTMTSSISNGFYILNSASATASGNSIRINSYPTFELNGSYPTYIETWFRVVNVSASNVVTEIGAGYITGATSAPTDGVFLRQNASNQWQAIVNFNGTETVATISKTISDSVTYHLGIVIHNEEAQFWIDDELCANIPVPTTQPSMMNSRFVQWNARIYNSGIATLGKQLQIGFVNVSSGDQNLSLDYATQKVLNGGSSIQTPTGTVTLAQTGNYTNSAAPSSATLSNTAAGYTTLGGQFQFAAVAGAETDYALFGYQVPAGSATQAGRSLLIRGITIDTFNTVVAVATSATVMQWTIGVGSTAVSLATADASAARSPKRTYLGLQTFPVGAAVGASAAQINVQFDSPLVCEAGSFVHIILKMPIGTATATEIFRGVVGVNAYFI